MNINVGDYVRTKEFGINMIKWFDNEEPILENGFTALQSGGYKSSPNIIDLIEVGDIISFKDGSICRIMEITDNGYYLLKDYGGEQYYERKEWIEELQSIVTKEQMEAMEYKIER